MSIGRPRRKPAVKNPPRKTKRGPQCKLTDVMANNIISMLQNGITVAVACQAVSIDHATYYRWIEQGKLSNPNTLLAKFAKGSGEARALGEINLVNIIQKSATTDPDDAKWLLERMHSERYGKKIETTLTTSQDKPITVMLPPIVAQPPPIPRKMHSTFGGNQLLSQHENNPSSSPKP